MKTNKLGTSTIALLSLTLASLSGHAESEKTAPNHLTVHEWGTFTSLQGSDGVVQQGLQHEEESLPAFVHGRDPLHEPQPGAPAGRPPGCRGKCLEFGTLANTPLAVTQKMETPVLYFYSNAAQHVDIGVRFPQGIISQYYPNPVDFSPAIGGVSSLSGGSVKFSVDVVKNAITPPVVEPTSIYAPARNTKADSVVSGSESERMIFYRGVGNFIAATQVTSKEGGIQIHNTGNERLSAVFLLNVTQDGGSILPLGGLAGQGNLNVGASEVSRLQGHSSPFSSLLPFAGGLLKKALESSGLYADESQAMVDTWKRSYFKNPGLRVIYILSREETDRILPISVQPQPDSLVRTLVGRIEVVLDTEEQALLKAIHEQKEQFDVSTLGRFGEAKLRRLAQITPDWNEQNTIQTLLTKFP